MPSETSNGNGYKKLFIEAVKIIVVFAVAWGSFTTTIRANSKAIDGKVNKDIFELHSEHQVEAMTEIRDQLKIINEKLDRIILYGN